MNRSAENEVLVLRDNAKHELMQIKTVEDGLTHLNKLKSIEVWIKAEKKDAELQNLIAEQKLRTQRILGNLIREGQERGEIKTQATAKSTDAVEVDMLGLTHKQSANYQKLASIPEQEFEEFINEKKELVNNAVSELTTAGALRLAEMLKTDYDGYLKQKKESYTIKVTTYLRSKTKDDFMDDLIKKDVHEADLARDIIEKYYRIIKVYPQLFDGEMVELKKFITNRIKL